MEMDDAKLILIDMTQTEHNLSLVGDEIYLQKIHIFILNIAVFESAR